MRFLRQIAVWALSLLLSLGLPTPAPAQAQSNVVKRVILSGKPSWLPRANGQPATLYADFANGRYWYQGSKDYASWLAALGGTFTRSSTAYRTNASGLLESVSSNVLRFDYDPVTLAPKGVLLEGARTNILLRSQELNLTWVTSNASISVDAVTAPDGTTTADTVSDNTSGAGAVHGPHQVLTIVSGTTYSFSTYVRAGGTNFVSLALCSSGTSGHYIYAIYDLSAVSVSQSGVGGTSGAIVSTSIINVGSGWYRIALVGSINKTDGEFDLSLSNLASGATINGFGEVTYAGASNRSATFWGAQVEAASFPSSYIPTTTGSATRAADVLNIASSPWYKPAASTVYARFYNTGVDQTGGGNGVFALNDGSGSNRIDLRAGASHFSIVSSGGSSQSNVSFSGVFSSPAKAALAVQAGDFAGNQNGGTLVTGTPALMPVGVTRMTLGYLDADASANRLYAPLSEIAYWPIRAPNADLQRLTSP